MLYVSLITQEDKGHIASLINKKILLKNKLQNTFLNLLIK